MSSSTLQNWFSKATAFASLSGALGGFLSFFTGEQAAGLIDPQLRELSYFLILLSSALWTAMLGLTIGITILIFDNLASLRGRWYRNVAVGVPVFYIVSFIGGMIGQMIYSVAPNSLTRGLGWSAMGASIGLALGLVRWDWRQAGRGVLGGIIGGFSGGYIFNTLTMISSANEGAFSRFVGQIIMGALIGLLMRVVQDALKDAWLLGVSTGPYEGKEYPLNMARVTVGRDGSNTISLFQEPDLKGQLGAFVYQSGGWFWQGDAVPVNGVAQANVPLHPEDTMQLGASQFRFKTKSGRGTIPNPGVIALAAGSATTEPSLASSPVASTPADTSAARTQIPPSPPPTKAPAGYALVSKEGRLIRLPDLTAPFNIGSAEKNQLVIADEAISSNHARLWVKNGELQVLDLGSTNGTFVNGVQLEPRVWRVLKHGDSLKFGVKEYALRVL